MTASQFITTVVIGFSLLSMPLVFADGKIMHDEATRICIQDDPHIYCERIFGNISNTERVIEHFFYISDYDHWYWIFKEYYQKGWITELEYVQVLEFGIENEFKYRYAESAWIENSWQFENKQVRNSIYEQYWEFLKNSDDFDRIFVMKR